MDNKEDPTINSNIKNTEKDKSDPSNNDMTKFDKIKWLTGC